MYIYIFICIYIYIGSRPEVPRKGILGESRYWWYTWGGVGWGGDMVGCWRSLQGVHAVDATLPMGWGGVGWGGMLPFAARCTRCGCYVADGVGWGGVGWDVAVRCKMYLNPGLDNVLKALKNFRARTYGVLKPTEAFKTPLWKVLWTKVSCRLCSQSDFVLRMQEHMSCHNHTFHRIFTQ